MEETDDTVEALPDNAMASPSNDTDFRRIRKFIEEMRERGILKKPEYNLPLIDTVGRNYRNPDE
jgi:hypothetical protein